MWSAAYARTEFSAPRRSSRNEFAFAWSHRPRRSGGPSSFRPPQFLDATLAAGTMQPQFPIAADDMKLGFTFRDHRPAAVARYASTWRDPDGQRRRYAEVAVGSRWREAGFRDELARPGCGLPRTAPNFSDAGECAYPLVQPRNERGCTVASVLHARRPPLGPARVYSRVRARYPRGARAVTRFLSGPFARGACALFEPGGLKLPPRRRR